MPWSKVEVCFIHKVGGDSYSDASATNKAK